MDQTQHIKTEMPKTCRDHWMRVALVCIRYTESWTPQPLFKQSLNGNDFCCCTNHHMRQLRPSKGSTPNSLSIHQRVFRRQTSVVRTFKSPHVLTVTRSLTHPLTHHSFTHNLTSCPHFGLAVQFLKEILTKAYKSLVFSSSTYCFWRKWRKISHGSFIYCRRSWLACDRNWRFRLPVSFSQFQLAVFEGSPATSRTKGLNSFKQLKTCTCWRSRTKYIFER